MRAAVFPGAGSQVVIERVALPTAGPDDVIVKVHRCGICGSDVSMTGNVPFPFPAGPIGHEYAGEIVEVGGNVRHLRPGDRVACLPATPCGRCDGCRSGNPIFCAAPQAPRDGRRYGGFGEYVAMPAGGAKPVPEWLSYADAALVEPMACGLHALRMAAMQPGARVLVLGAGSMAMAMVFWARRLGAGRVVIVSRSAHRRDVGHAFGADAFHCLAEDDPAALSEALGGLPDIVAECIGQQGMLASALDHVRPHGTVISMGMCQHAEPIVAAAWTFKEARLLFPLGYTAGEFAETARAFEAARFHPDLMVGEVIPLEALPGTLEDLRAGRRQCLKIQVDPSPRT